MAHNTASGHSKNPVHRQISEAWRAKKYDQTAKMAEAEGVKQGGDWFSTPGSISPRMHGSKSSARKAASARIAKIPLRLGRHIAAFYRPEMAA